MRGKDSRSRRERRVLIGVELLAIILWALAFARPYLNLDPLEVPAGPEYPSTIQGAHVWTRALQCGLCAMWNGNLGGGAPAFVDPLGGHLHPLFILTATIFGVPAGAKLAIVGALIMAGLAQWWLGWVLGLGRAGRLFGAAMAVVGGHLALRMEQGSFPMLFSAAACSVVFAPLVLLSRTPTRRSAVLLGIAVALAALSGQGYLQMGMLLSLPIPLIFLFGQPGRIGLFARRLGLAAALSALLAAPLLVPFLHFADEFQKDTDPTFQCAQSLSLVPLSLVVNDRSFYGLYSRLYRKNASPGQYLTYVGFIPVLLAFYGVGWTRGPQRRREIAFLALSIFFALWFASSGPIPWMFHASRSPGVKNFLAGIRFSFYFTSLAVPPLLALAGIGADRLLRRRALAVSQAAAAVVALVAIFLSLRSAWNFNRQFVATIRRPETVVAELEALRTPDLQWVSAPFGEHHYSELATGMGLKLSHGIRFWDWKDHTWPEPVLWESRAGPPPGMRLLLTLPTGLSLYKADPGGEYAVVTQADGSRVVCSAQGIGGDIDVTCPGSQGGVLRVLENSWNGWRASVDGRAEPLLTQQWLSLRLPAGHHRIQLRYRPWDVPVGALLCLAGIFLSAFVWMREEPRSVFSVEKGVEAPEEEPMGSAIGDDQAAEGIQGDSRG